MNTYTLADLRAWGVICALIALTGMAAARFATTGHGFTALAVLALVSLALILAWARRRVHLERRGGAR